MGTWKICRACCNIYIGEIARGSPERRSDSKHDVPRIHDRYCHDPNLGHRFLVSMVPLIVLRKITRTLKSGIEDDGKLVEALRRRGNACRVASGSSLADASRIFGYCRRTRSGLSSLNASVSCRAAMRVGFVAFHPVSPDGVLHFLHSLAGASVSTVYTDGGARVLVRSQTSA